ncbi:hypothetical protein NNJEOMEG_01995 [Fundidesulfovibrio magnetotacticus]|uniref:PilZ domain-containing protein n=1 Tax=Fundidesulfovibrio magnetotacticus TaxID=2730080 RepID=A0A6V8M119_9BACT|nr:hypothetical protein [Fundidesulfovibrio magnetotacticus]GFK94155.1 hypothetical protein NNJEOMEG_01995 [Fundidesulfovibrio magnetotacticus]
MEQPGEPSSAGDASNRRADYRVEVPASHLRELALWPGPAEEHVRVTPACLGRPRLTLSRLGHGRLLLTDLSIRGLGMLLHLRPEDAEWLRQARKVYIYLQLWDPTHDDPFGVLSVFTSCHLVRVADTPRGLFAGARFLRFAVGSRLEKALEFLDARMAGVTALARWCDNIARGEQPVAERRYPGLDLDNLLAEIENALTERSPCVPEGGETQ